MTFDIVLGDVSVIAHSTYNIANDVADIVDSVYSVDDEALSTCIEVWRMMWQVLLTRVTV